MQPVVAPRRMKWVPPACAFLYKDHQNVSQRTVEMLRALSPDRKRLAPLAAPRACRALGLSLPTPNPRFGHGLYYHLSDNLGLLASYHPS